MIWTVIKLLPKKMWISENEIIAEILYLSHVVFMFNECSFLITKYIFLVGLVISLTKP